MKKINKDFNFAFSSDNGGSYIEIAHLYDKFFMSINMAWRSEEIK